MNLLNIGVLVSLMTFGLVSFAKENRIPYFEDYPAKPMFTGKPAKVVLETRDAKNFRTRLREAMKEPADFSGDYVLAHWGCGTSCAHGAVVSLRTGHVVFLPGTVCCWGGDDGNTEYRKDSRLLILRGRVNEAGSYGKHFYVFTGRKFKHVRTVSMEDTYLKDFGIKMRKGLEGGMRTLEQKRKQEGAAAR